MPSTKTTSLKRGVQREIANHYPLTFPAVAKHLDVLHRAKLVSKARHGRELLVSIAPETLLAASRYLDTYQQPAGLTGSLSEDHHQERQREQLMEPIKEVVLERTYDAPLDTVWQAWTRPEMLRQWWGPANVTIPECEVDLSVGGKFYIVMEAGAGMGPYAGTQWPMHRCGALFRPERAG